MESTNLRLKILANTKEELKRAEATLTSIGFSRGDWETIPDPPVFLEARDGEVYWMLGGSGKKAISISALEHIAAQFKPIEKQPMKTLPIFRFWNHIVGRMSAELTLKEINEVDILWTNVIPLQFTGFTELNMATLNERKIFESDIVQVAFHEFGSPIPADFTGVVRFMESGFYVNNDAMGMGFPVWQEIAEWKILGNEFENPELKKHYELPTQNDEPCDCRGGLNYTIVSGVLVEIPKN